MRYKRGSNADLFSFNYLKKLKQEISNKTFVRNQRGLSAIIVTLILILLSIVAVGIVWVVVTNILKSNTENVSSGVGQLSLNLELQNVLIRDTGEIDVIVKRNAGEGDLSGINFIVSDGKNSDVIERPETINELETKTFTITSTDLNNAAFVKEVSIAPVSGGKAGNAVDTFEFNRLKLIYDQISNKDCATLGSSYKNPSTNSWTAGFGTADCGDSDSDVGSASTFSCTSKVNLAKARDTCEFIGARLCTRDELRGGAAEATGCGFGTRGLWTSTECGNNGFYVEEGTRNSNEYCEEDFEATIPSQDIFTNNDKIGVRCCADD